MADWAHGDDTFILIGGRAGDRARLEPLTSGATSPCNLLIYNVFSAFKVLRSLGGAVAISTG